MRVLTSVFFPLASCLYKLLWNAYLESGGDNFDDGLKLRIVPCLNTGMES